MPTEKVFNERGQMVKISWGRSAEVVLGVADDEGHGTEGRWFIPLTRREDVNQVIRKLRRARDQAFGRDE